MFRRWRLARGGRPAASRLLRLSLLAPLLLNVSRVLCDESEYRLTQYLMSNYDPSVRPARNSAEPLEVNFSLSLHHIIDVDERNQILTTNCWLTHVWTDYHLTWNTSDFGGVQKIRVPYFRVWKPDIILYNNADSQYSTAVINTNVIVNSNGQVTWLSHGIYQSSCDMDVEYFPFDIQSCEMKWASWTYDGYTVDIISESPDGDLSNYQSNGEFDLVDFSAKRNVQNYSCCPEPYPDITYTIRLRRRPMFYVFNLILPCILINGIALLVFYVPSESGEKVTLGISAVLSMTVFLMTIRESLPPTEKTPLISLYYGVTICLVSFASGLSVLTLNIFHRGSRGIEVPRLVRTIVLGFLSRIVFIHFEKPPIRPGRPRGAMADLTQRADGLLNSLGRDRRTMADGDSLDSLRYPCRRGHHTTEPPTMLPPSEDFERNFVRVLNRIYQTIERNETRLEEQEYRDATRQEWQQVAIVCDRVLLLIFLLSTATATSAILLSSPHLH
ncbi:neuronal acetylcholine receptor subunit alpha-10-like [Amphibalanus amphitrite]|uniref:neuronal acetylcholine receptor subunit alpha-10-like n=2 Tax=Amphibalanus amphitrite TaxID=1232801 RepID=UPI001C929DC3|nr:neuronal acetylcholine receptor subunit alpha-10-like [Amphibalanus amphitrite]